MMLGFMQAAAPKLLIPTTQPSLRVNNMRVYEGLPKHNTASSANAQRAAKARVLHANIKAEETLNALPYRFTIADVIESGVPKSNSGKMIKRLIAMGLVVKLTDSRTGAIYGKSENDI